LARHIQFRQAPKHPAAVRFIKGHQIQIADALDQWLRAKRTEVEPTTYAGYEKAVRYHLRPQFGAMRLSELQPSDVKNWLSGLASSGKTKNNVLTPLRGVFQQAFLDERIDRNPMERVPKADHTTKEPDPLSQKELAAALASSEGQIRNIIQFAAYSGLRTSELIALRWIDVDLSVDKVHIRVTRTNAGEKSYGKTATSVRTIDLHPPARIALESQLRFTDGKRSVFENPKSGEPWKHDGPYRKIAWIPTLKKAGVRPRPAYQTRHTFASMLLSVGADPSYIASQMGHKDWGMIRKVYARWLPEFSQGQIDKIAGLWTATGQHENAAS
jgi:integrase